MAYTSSYTLRDKGLSHTLETAALFGAWLLHLSLLRVETAGGSMGSRSLLSREADNSTGSGERETAWSLHQAAL